MEQIKLDFNKFPAINEGKNSFKDQYYRLSKGVVASLRKQIDTRRGYLVSPSITELHNEYKYRRIANVIYKIAKNIGESAIQSAAVEDSKKVVLQLASTDKGNAIKFRLKNTKLQ